MRCCLYHNPLKFTLKKFKLHFYYRQGMTKLMSLLCISGITSQGGHYNAPLANQVRKGRHPYQEDKQAHQLNVKTNPTKANGQSLLWHKACAPHHFIGEFLYEVDLMGNSCVKFLHTYSPFQTRELRQSEWGRRTHCKSLRSQILTPISQNKI